MSNAPLDKLVANKTALAAVGLGGGFVALCSGFLVMALVTVGVLRSDPGFDSAGNAATSTAPDTATRSTNLGDTSDPGEVVTSFFKFLQQDRADKAWDLTAENFGETRSEFASRMSKTKTLLRSRAEWKSSSDAAGGFTYKGRIIGPNGNSQFDLELVRKGNGFRVRSFSISD